MDNRLYNVKSLKCCEPDEKPSKCHGLYEIVNNIVKENVKDKQNKLIAGDNITIKDDVISATGGGGSVEQQQTDWDQTDESAVDYIKNKPTNVSSFVNDVGYLTEHQDISGKQDKLTAGDRITIEENVISAQDGVASDVSYDNTRTGLSAANVQDAIDEMADTNLYETVVLTVGSADSTFNPVGQTITVTLEDGSATQYTVPMSRQITFIVQRGMRYTISGTSTDDYRVLPLSVKAAIPIRYLTMRYIPIATGVFILQKDGNYYLREEYDAETMAEDAVGVLVLTSALITAKFGIVISKDDIDQYGRWNSGTSWVSVNSNSTTALNGYTNTQLYLSHSNKAQAVAANRCAASKIYMNDGTIVEGYWGSVAECSLINKNRTEINNCMEILNGGKILRTDYVTSTNVRPGGSWGNVKSNNAFAPYNENAYWRTYYRYLLS